MLVPALHLGVEFVGQGLPPPGGNHRRQRLPQGAQIGIRHPACELQELGVEYRLLVDPADDGPQLHPDRSLRRGTDHEAGQAAAAERRHDPHPARGLRIVEVAVGEGPAHRHVERQLQVTRHPQLPGMPAVPLPCSTPLTSPIAPRTARGRAPREAVRIAAFGVPMAPVIPRETRETRERGAERGSTTGAQAGTAAAAAGGRDPGGGRAVIRLLRRGCAPPSAGRPRPRRVVTGYAARRSDDRW